MLCYVSSTFASSIFLLLFLSSFLTHTSSCLAFVFLPSSSLSSPPFPSFFPPYFFASSRLPLLTLSPFLFSFISFFHMFPLLPLFFLLSRPSCLLSNLFSPLAFFFLTPAKDNAVRLKIFPLHFKFCGTFLHILLYYQICWNLGD